MMGMILSIVFTANQLYRVQTVNLDALQLVLVGTTLEVTAFTLEIPTGVIADIYSRRLSVIIGIFLFALGFIIEASIPLFVTVLLAQVVWGAGWTFISGAKEAWIADEVGTENVGPIYLRGAQYSQSGNLLGIPLFVLLGNLSYSTPILIGGMMFFLLGIFLSLYMPESGFQRAPAIEINTIGDMWSTLREGFQLTRQHPILFSFVGIAVFVGLYREGYDRLMEAHFLNSFSFPRLSVFSDPVVAWFGIMRLVASLLILTATELIKRRLDTYYETKLVRILQAFCGLVSIGIFAFTITQNFTIALSATWLVSTTHALTFPFNQAWINQYIDSKVRATVLSMTSQVDAFGQIIGGPIVGVLGRLRSIRVALTTSSLILLPVIPLFERLIKRHMKKPAKSLN
jgi:DHA3 family tetracycline resistance protein-like MFS transporter